MAEKAHGLSCRSGIDLRFGLGSGEDRGHMSVTGETARLNGTRVKEELL